MYQREGISAFKKDLSNIKALLDYLDNPETKLNVIHIAGTNGKGSTTHLVASILQELAHSVACYTSPHYKDFRERIKINGEFIPEDFVVNFVEDIKPLLKSVPASFFELTVAMAFSYFESMKPDFCIIETGLGGRLDSTNVVDPLLSVITNISFDHQNMLGDTLIEIASEKAGIIKRNKPVLIGERQTELEPIFSAKANEENSTLIFADELIEMKNNNFIYEEMTLAKISREEPDYFIKNKSTSLAVICQLARMKKIRLPSTTELSNAFNNLHKNTYFIGRNMLLGTNPLIIADSGHNQAGIRALLDYVLDLKFDKLHVVCGFVQDKVIEDIIEYFPLDARYYFAKADVIRAMPAEILQSSFDNYSRKGIAFKSPQEALSVAKTKATNKDLILICGSIFLVAELI